MNTLLQKVAPICIMFLAVFLIDSGVVVDNVDARSKMGGRMFSRPAPKKAPAQQTMKQQTSKTNQSKGGFGRGLAGGLLGGALGGMLFGSLFGASGSGMGLLPILLLGGVGYFLFRRFASQARSHSSARPSPPNSMFGTQGGTDNQNIDTEEQEQFSYLTPVEQGIAEIQQTDADFDRSHFVEIASDVFFQVQAGWMRRDLDSYRHLLGSELAEEYAAHFAELETAGHINKLESIAIRKVEVVNAASDGREDFVTVLFTANLLDYTVDEKTGDLVSGSMTTPVKFAEEWTWARSTGTENWLLEGINVISE